MDLKELSEDEVGCKSFCEQINNCINGIGNLLLIKGSENSSVGNKHPADKKYPYSGGSYDWHDKNRDKWRSSKEWSKLIRARGKDIFDFMLANLVDAPEKLTSL
jgi:hypothetical protein